MDRQLSHLARRLVPGARGGDRRLQGGDGGLRGGRGMLCGTVDRFCNWRCCSANRSLATFANSSRAFDAMANSWLWYYVAEKADECERIYRLFENCVE